MLTRSQVTKAAYVNSISNQTRTARLMMCTLVSETFCDGSSDAIVSNEITLRGAVKDPLRCYIINVYLEVCFGLQLAH